jgi:plastocyanin
MVLSPRVVLSVVAVTGLVVFGVACGGDDDAGTAAPTTTTAPRVDDAPGDAPGDAEDVAVSTGPIVISGFSFGNPITVAAGSEVRVINNDSSAHTLTAVDGTFDSGDLGIGEDFTFVVETPGTYEFFCAIHPSMTGSMIVTG